MQELPCSIIDVGLAAKTVDAQNNRIKELPPTLGELRNVHRLVLAKNLLENLHSVTALANLKVWKLLPLNTIASGCLQADHCVAFWMSFSTWNRDGHSQSIGEPRQMQSVHASI